MKSKTVSRLCPVCESASAQVVHTQKFVLPEGHPLPKSYDVVCCERCGFCYADTAATQADYDEFYRSFSKYADNATSTGGGGSAVDLERLSRMASDIAGFATDKNARIVDLGCANGGLLRELKDRGYRNLCGVDPSPACVEQVRALGIEAYTGFLSDIPAEAGPIDGVVLSHVLEHVRDLVPMLEKLRKSMSPNGWIYAETPDASRYIDFIFAPFQDFNTEHINHFSLTGLGNLLRRVGFETCGQGSKNISSAPGMPYPAIYIFGRLRENPGGIEKDGALEKSLESYVAGCRQLMESMDSKIQASLREDNRVMVWGVGQLAMKLLVETSLANATVTAFIDGNPVNRGKTINGVQVISPADLTDRVTPILIASTINQGAILETIRGLKLPNKLITLGDS